VSETITSIYLTRTSSFVIDTGIKYRKQNVVTKKKLPTSIIRLLL